MTGDDGFLCAKFGIARSIAVITILLTILLIATACGSGSGGSPANAPQGDANDTPGTIPLDITASPPPQLVTGVPFCFTPDVRNPAGAPLRFTATNLPAWASIDRMTGEITGTPRARDVGTWRNVTITVSGRGTTAQAEPFALEVVDTAPGSVTLSWIPPTENADGTSLTDLSGYRIYYGQCRHSLRLAVTLEGRGLTRYVVSDLTPDLWYFNATAYNADGVESQFSNTASLQIM